MIETVSQYVNDLGPAVALPFLIFALALVLRQPAGDALRSALKIGVGFVGIQLVLGLFSDELGPAARAMVDRFGVELTAIDVGWPSTAAIAFGARVGALVIPIGLAVNIVMLGVGLTKTLDIDLWNYWHIAFSGALVAILTGSFTAGRPRPPSTWSSCSRSPTGARPGSSATTSTPACRSPTGPRRPTSSSPSP
ncbi:hypothetical protein BH20ACT9_BH20ACT9_21480 [soil metagenome]